MIREGFSDFLSALSFITIVPVHGQDVFKAHRMVPYFPVVGLLIGLGLLATHQVTGTFFPKTLSGALDVLYLCVITGAFHLDGLGDAADGLFSHRPREQALEIMKDSRVGVMGLTAVVMCLMVKWAALSGVPSHRQLGLVLIPSLARSGILFGMKLMPYGRPQGGTGKAFFERSLDRKAFVWVSIPLAGGLFMGGAGMLLLAACLALTFSMIGFFKRQMGCITGDMLGAMVEVTEMGLLTVLCVSMGSSS